MKRMIVIVGILLVGGYIGWIFFADSPDNNGTSLGTSGKIALDERSPEAREVAQFVATGGFVDDIQEAIPEGSSIADVVPDDIVVQTTSLLSSFVGNVCLTIQSPGDFPRSSVFLALKRESDRLLKTTYRKSQDEFLYVMLPRIIEQSCLGRDANYKEMIANTLAVDSVDFAMMGKLDKDVELKKVYDYLDSWAIKFNTNNFDKKTTLSSPKEFNDFFLKDNAETIKAIFFTYYTLSRNDLSKFLYQPIDVLADGVVKKDKQVTVLQDRLKELGMTLTEFADKMLKNSGYMTWQEIAQSMLADYGDLLVINPWLSKNLSSIWAFRTFVNNGDYIKLFAHKESRVILDRIVQKMLVLNVILPDNAGNLNESWSWKQFFNDTANGNAIIRLFFASLLISE